MGLATIDDCIHGKIKDVSFILFAIFKHISYWEFSCRVDALLMKKFLLYKFCNFKYPFNHFSPSYDLLLQGVFNTGATFCLVSWAIAKRGPIYPSMFNSLSVIFTIILESLFMGQDITIGRFLFLKLKNPFLI